MLTKAFDRSSLQQKRWALVAALLLSVVLIAVVPHQLHKARAVVVNLQARLQGFPAIRSGRPTRRAAVCFLGLTRSLEYVKDTIRGNIFDVLIRHGWEYDVYLHTYNQTTLSNPRSNELNVALDTDAWRLLQPKRFIVEDPARVKMRIDAELDLYLKHGDAFEETTPHTSLHNLLLQYHSLEQVTSLWQTWDYDVVLYLRPDMWYFNALNMTHVATAAAQPNAIYVPAFGWWKDLGINDRVAFGHPRVMKVYGNRGQHARAYAQQFPMHSESYAKYALDHAGISILKTDLLAARMRSTGILWGVPELINGTYSFNTSRPLDPYRHYFIAKTSPLGSWGASRCNGTTDDGSQC